MPALLLTLLLASLASSAQRHHFQFGSGHLDQSSIYTATSRQGFEDASAIACDVHECGSDKPFFFSIDLPEGNYDVTVKLGAVTDMTLRAEARRLIASHLNMPTTLKFTVNVRYPEISTGGTVRLNDREVGTRTWDKRLSLEFNGRRAAIQTLDIQQTDKAITVYLAGDSTVVDQTAEPWAAWGQMLPQFFKQGVSIANHAESGRALKSFLADKRLDKILSMIVKGDYLFIQFTHNDQKPGSSYVEPFTTYKEHLKLYIGEARKHGAIPVLVTSMHRRTFDNSGKITNSLKEYPEAMRQTAAEEKVALIDLTAMSQLFYESMGSEGSIKAFVHYPAGTFPGQQRELKDNTHFNGYGAYQLAQCIVEGIRANHLGLVKYLRSDIPHYDAAHPDDVSKWNLPLSPQSSARTPF